MASATEANIYDRRQQQLRAAGYPQAAAALAVVDAYLDGKPAHRGRRKLTWAERDAAFWSSSSVLTLAIDDWRREGPALALARYFGQSRVAAIEVLTPIAATAPDAIILAVRHSGLVRHPDSPRRHDLARLAGDSAAIAELVDILAVFDRAERDRRLAIAQWTGVLAGLSPFELLAYASLHAFEHLLPRNLLLAHGAESERLRWLDFCEAINDILVAALGSAPTERLNPGPAEIAESVGRHLSPFVFPAAGGVAARHELREAFARLVGAQIEFNAYVAQSADAFSYDDGVSFVRNGDSLDLIVTDDSLRQARQAENDKLLLLNRYWSNRAHDAFVKAGMNPAATWLARSGDAERLAHLRAYQTALRLTEVYGVNSSVTTAAGDCADLVQALLALNLMSAFFRQEFLVGFAQHLAATGHPLPALAALAYDGLASGGQIRLPLTWSDRDAKIARLAAWLASEALPDESPPSAAAILDFWTSDWSELADRIRRGEPGVHPALFERPVLKLGEILVQLPWVVGMQDNSAAAINNLRRLGANRGEAGDETRRIESRLGEYFAQRGFRVVQGWHPGPDGDADPGEVDLICARDDHVLVLEVKSTYLRHTLRDAWLHATTTLRKAGQQLQRKLAAVERGLQRDGDLRASLGVDGNATTPELRGWIVDTSIECDHRRFAGFLKVSVEEVLIALRDERTFLDDPAGIRVGRLDDPGADGVRGGSTLYPEGFDAGRFFEVIEGEAVWQTHTGGMGCR